MSTPVITQVLTDLVGRLQAAATVAGSNVERARDVDLDAVELPIILVFVKDIEAGEDAFLGNNRTYEREVALQIEAYLPTQSGLDDALYLIEDQIRAVVMADETHGGLATQTLWRKTAFDWTTENVEDPFGWAVVEFTVYYREL